MSRIRRPTGVRQRKAVSAETLQLLEETERAKAHLDALPDNETRLRAILAYYDDLPDSRGRFVGVAKHYFNVWFDQLIREEYRNMLTFLSETPIGSHPSKAEVERMRRMVAYYEQLFVWAAPVFYDHMPDRKRRQHAEHGIQLAEIKQWLDSYEPPESAENCVIS